MQRQLERYLDALEQAESVGIRPRLRHLANSAATLALPDARFDAVRPGLAVYGLSPMPDLATSAELGLRPAMSLVSRVVMVKDVPEGQGVSYGLTHVTSTATTLALLPLGYGDGLPRHAAGPVPCCSGGRRSDRRPCLHGPGRPGPRRRRTPSGWATSPSSSARAVASPRPRTGPTPAEPSATRSSPVSEPVSRRTTGGAEDVLPEARWKRASVGRGDLARSGCGRRRRGRPARRGDGRARRTGRATSLGDGAHRAAVTADDGTVLHVEVERCTAGTTRPLTVVLCHGYALNAGLVALPAAGAAGSPRLVLYDQRSHGRSQRAGLSRRTTSTSSAATSGR